MEDGPHHECAKDNVREDEAPKIFGQCPSFRVH